MTSNQRSISVADLPRPVRLGPGIEKAHTCALRSRLAARGASSKRWEAMQQGGGT
jgi:hypothetical protein